MGMTTDIRIALVGAGYMAGEHARAFGDLPGVRVIGVVGRNQDRARALADTYGADVFDDVAAMYEATKADAVVVAVNELSMPAVAESVLRLPWLSLFEKPVGLTLPAAQAILKTARTHGATAYVALNRRSYSSTLNALDLLAQDAGTRLISVLDQQDLESVRQANQPESVIRNYMFANSIHLIDYFLRFGRGTVEQVQVTSPWNDSDPGYVTASLQFSSGDHGVYQAVWRGPGPWAVSVTNPAIRAEMRPLESLQVQKRGERKLVEVSGDELDRNFKPGLHRQARELCRAIRGETPDLCDLEENFRSMLLCAQIYGFAPLPDKNR